MVKLNEDYVFRIKSVCNIDSVVSNYVELKYSGRNKKCCCPFHSEKTPSFFVFEDTQSFYCFGCGVGGDVITFVEKIENLSYLEAVKFLARFAGIEFPSEEFGFDDEKVKRKARILKINKDAARFYYNNLKREECRHALDYLLKVRNLKKETIVKFGLGFATKGWKDLAAHLRRKGYSDEEIKDSDLVLKTRNGNLCDRFRNRIIFPIIDLNGDVVAFGGRLIEKTNAAKYINSSDTLVFKKSLGLYGLNFAKKSRFKSFILCEGYLDVISLHQNGIDCAVATLGTALTKEQVRLLLRHSKEVILAYDMDDAGERAIKRAFLMFEEVGICSKILNFKDAKDPDEYVNRFGAKKFLNVVFNAKTIEKLKFQNILKKYDLNDSEQKKQYVLEYCKILAQIKDPLKKDIYIGEICSKLKLDRYIIKKQVDLIYNKHFKRFKKLINREYDRNTKLLKTYKNLPLKVVKAEEGILRYLYFNPDAVDLIKKKIEKNWFNVEWHKNLFDFLINAIKNKRNLDFSILHEILNAEEIGLFSKIVNSKNMYKNIFKEFEDCYKTLKSFFDYKHQNVLSLTLEELEQKRKEKAELKF